MKTLKILIIILILFILSDLYSQRIEGTSGKVQLSIKVLPEDNTPPEVIISGLREVSPEFPIQIRDNEIKLLGKINDLTGGSRVFIYENDALVRVEKLKRSDSLNIILSLKQGLNNYKIKVYDRKKNYTEKEFKIYKDADADISQPNIVLKSPTPINGVNVLKKGGMVPLDINCSDEKGIYRLYINNTPVSSTSSNSYTYNMNSDATDTLIIKAIDSSGNIAYKTFYFNPPPDTTKLKPGVIEYFGLFLAIENYQDKNINKLETPKRDSKKLMNVLTSKYHFDPRNVVYMEDPTRDQIFEKLDSLANILDSTDNLFIFYSGHGNYNEKKNQGYWLPSDANLKNPSKWISNSDIRDLINGIKSQHTLLVTDACFSGSIFQGTTKAVVDSFIDMLKPTESKVYVKKSRKAMTSGENAPVPDKGDFMKFLISELDNYDKPVYAAEDLFNVVRLKVRNSNENNPTPHFGVILGTGDELGDFLFFRKTN